MATEVSIGKITITDAVSVGSVNAEKAHAIVSDISIPVLYGSIDDELSTESTNPVQNRIITTEIDKKIDTGNVRELTNMEIEKILGG